MQYAILRRILAVLIGLGLAATGLWASPASEEEPAAAMEKEMVMDPATGKMVTAPEYGGTLTYGWGGRVSDNVDPFAVGFEAGWLIDGVNEKLAIGDWALDREVFDWTDNFVPTHVLTGNLAESWETPDPVTYVFHIRQGVHYALDPDSEASRLVNGRELTADDVVYSYQRQTAQGDFTEPPAQAGPTFNLLWESIEATDKYTVVMKLTEPYLDALQPILGESQSWILPRDVIEHYGNYEDWKNVVGTGPLILTEYVEGAEKLLDEAGYPRGADGIRFTAEYLHRDVIDLGYTEVAAGYWADIGVDITTRIADTGTWVAAKAETAYEMATGDMGHPAAGWAMQTHRDSNLFPREYLACSDPCAIDTSVLDAASDAYYAATTKEEQFEAAKAYNMFVLEQHMQIWGPLAPQFQANNPWVKGYNGEYSLGDLTYHPILARLWIDQDLKREMGF